MSIPTVSENVRDGGLNQSEPASLLPIVIGPSSIGDAGVFGLFGSVNDLKDTYGEGVGVEQAGSLFQAAKPIGFVKAAASVAAAVGTVTGEFTEDGTAGSVTHDPDTGAGPLITVDPDGAVRSFASIVITITTGGALETAEFTWNTGSGASAPVVTGEDPYTFAIPNTGVTITFPAGTYVLNDAYTFTVTQGGPVLSVTGTPNYDTLTKVEITKGGALGAANFRYSCDAYDGDKSSERTWSENIIVPAGGTYAVPGMGFNLVFAAGTYFVGDVYSFTTTAAGMNATNLGDAFTPIIASETPWRYAVVATNDGVGDSTAHALLVAALQSQLSALAATSRYRRGIIAAGGGLSSQAAAALSALSATAAERVQVVFGKVRRATLKPLPGFAIPTVPSADVVAQRAAASLLSTDLKRVRSGPLQVVKSFHDENKQPSGLDDIRVTTLRTWDGRRGLIYVTQGRLKSAPGSDFDIWPRGLVMDVACETIHDVLVEAVGRGLRTVTNEVNGQNYPGVLDPKDAGSINDEATDRLVQQLLTPINAEGYPGHIQAVSYVISNTHNYASSGVILGALSLKPLFYARDVVTQVGFVVDLPVAA